MGEADKRSYIYTKFATPYGQVELTVEGSEGETSEDISGLFNEKLDRVLDRQNRLAGDNDDKRGVE